MFDDIFEDKVDLLPEGWDMAIDPESGDHYYYNEKEGISSWDRPSSNTPPVGDSSEYNANHNPKHLVHSRSFSSDVGRFSSKRSNIGTMKALLISSAGLATLNSNKDEDESLKNGWSFAFDEEGTHFFLDF